jgi:small-conductance mechanosensitive channel
LISSDLTPAFPDAESAQAAFKVFDKDNNGDLSRTEIKSLFVNTYKERRFLAKSMRDVGEALRTLDHCLLALAMIILFFISLSVFGVSVGSSLTSIYSIAIAASFIFQSTASRAFDAIMFLFVTQYGVSRNSFSLDMRLTPFVR